MEWGSIHAKSRFIIVELCFVFARVAISPDQKIHTLMVRTRLVFRESDPLAAGLAQKGESATEYLLIISDSLQSNRKSSLKLEGSGCLFHLTISCQRKLRKKRKNP